MNRRAFLRHLPAAAAMLASGTIPIRRAQAATAGVVFNVRRFGAKGNGKTKDTRAIQRAIDAAGREGGCVYFPPGRYLSGTLQLRSHVTMQLENGSTLVAAPERGDFDDYEQLGYNSFSDKETSDFHYALIRGRELERVGVLGPGGIDMARQQRGGPKALALKLCRDVLIRDLTIENSPNYNISLLGCDFVDILGVTIRNGYADGIDPDCCRHVRIANCFVASMDDAIVPKASPSLGYLRATEHVSVTNCEMTTACNGFKLGTESSGGFKDIVLNNCVIYSDTEVWHGHRAASGISLETVDGGVLERVGVSNIIMKDVRAPIYVRLGNRGRGQRVPAPQRLRDISISDIIATGADLASSITGLPGFPVTGITLRNFRVTTRGGGKSEQAAQPVPEREKEYPDAKRMGNLPGYGLYCRHIDGLTVTDLHFAFENSEGRPAIVCDEVRNLDLRNLTARPPEGEQPVVWFNNTRNCFVQGCRALPGTTRWASVTGAATFKFVESGNELTQASRPFEIGREVGEGDVELENAKGRKPTSN